MLYNIILAVHVLVCLVLIIVVLMQSSKGGGLAGAFGGGGGGEMFGAHETATFLTKATTYLAVAFMLLSLILAFLAGNRTSGSQSVIRRSLQEQGNVIPTGRGVDEMLTNSVFDSVPADTTQQQ